MRKRTALLALTTVAAGLLAATATAGTTQASRDWGKPPHSVTVAESRDWVVVRSVDTL